VAVRERWIPFPSRWFEIASERWSLPRIEWFASFDVLFAPNFVPPPTGTDHLVVTVHDLAFRLFPETAPHGTRRWLARLDAAVRRAARLGDAWHPIALRPPGLLFPDEYAKRAKELRAWAQQAGRDPMSIELTVRVPMEVRPRGAKSPGGDRPLFQGTAADVIADIRAYASAGVTHFVFDPTVPDLKAALTNMERFAQDVRGKVKAASRHSLS
jgi:alkanesulfonate monooxygenase SsuD/methylene tetrahydromethanopterin reductase-like flavin-dependent oxidoreductase (luciferase family)